MIKKRKAYCKPSISYQEIRIEKAYLANATTSGGLPQGGTTTDNTDFNDQIGGGDDDWMVFN